MPAEAYWTGRFYPATLHHQTFLLKISIASRIEPSAFLAATCMSCAVLLLSVLCAMLSTMSGLPLRMAARCVQEASRGRASFASWRWQTLSRCWTTNRQRSNRPKSVNNLHLHSVLSRVSSD